MTKELKISFADYLFKALEAHSVDTLFGIPGVHTAELYRSLANTNIRHITPRHEQAAGFMADGYARVTGKPGVCMVITGPGISNIATAMLQAMGDAIPMLVIATCNNPSAKPLARLHEMPDQSAFCAQITSFTRTVNNLEELTGAIHDAFTLFEFGKPGPVLLEIPLSVICSKDYPPKRLTGIVHPATEPDEISDLRRVASALNNAENPLLIIGGGARHASTQILDLAERLDAPVITTINASSCLPTNHPLVVRASPSLAPVRTLINKADFVLAVGTQISPTDFDIYNTGRTINPKRIFQINIDERIDSRINRHEEGIVGDAKRALCRLLDQVPISGREADGAARVKAVNHAAYETLSADYRRYVSILELIQSTLPGAAMIGDSTQLVYAGNLYYPPEATGHWFNSSVGFGTLGYALPAAIGAKLGQPEMSVVALIGDGGMQFCLPELGTLRDLGIPVIVLVWNNNGYGEIRTHMKNLGIVPQGVNIKSPNFSLIADAYDIAYIELKADKLKRNLAETLRKTCNAGKGTLIEINDR